MINYHLLAKSLDHYENYEFKRIESPWLVSEAIDDITKPKDVEPYVVMKGDKTKHFVASGEQSFLYLINKGFLPDGKYQTITPCMRNDDFDSWHTKYFMKNELIHFGDVKESDVEKIMEVALSFFRSIVNNQSKLTIQRTEDGYDINYFGIEIGSYGIRSCEFVTWIYGTGLAEPRFSRTNDFFKG